MWLLPSRGRPYLARRLLDSGFQTPGLLILDEDEAETYHHIEFQDGWEKLVLPRMYLGPKLNAAVKERPNEEWYGILNDDHLPKTLNWDVMLVECLLRQQMVWPQDNYGDRISTPVFRGDLVRQLGWISPPGINHFYIDDVHELIAECLGCYRLECVTVSHEHVNAGRMPRDRTWAERPNNETDRRAFLGWCKEEWPLIRKRLEF